MYEDLNERQINIFEYIKRYIQFKGYPPAIREIANSLEINSTSTVHSNILKLEKKGYIRRDPLKNRALEIINDIDDNIQKKDTFDIPIVGNVTAGEPILAIENIEDTYPIPIEYSSYGNLFMLNVKGESMINAGILDGDKVIVRKQNTAENGEIVVALIDESATVKRFFKRNNYVELVPENTSMSPIILHNVVILGKVISLVRTSVL